MSANLSLRRLDQSLHDVEVRLWAWADWARHNGENIGWPGTSVAWRLAHIHEIGASIVATCPTVEIPEPIADVDEAVSKLDPILKAIVMVHYFSSDPIEVKARRVKRNQSVYSRLLDNARWSVKTLLRL